jgi:hypothetical protein
MLYLLGTLLSAGHTIKSKIARNSYAYLESHLLGVSGRRIWNSRTVVSSKKAVKPCLTKKSGASGSGRQRSERPRFKASRLGQIAGETLS